MSDWACTAYGEEVAAAVGARCFFAAVGERVCADQAACRAAMGAERRRVFRRINELSAAGDPTMEYLSEAFPDPNGLLDAE